MEALIVLKNFLYLILSFLLFLLIGVDATSAMAQLESFTYTLNQSTDSLQLWTTLPSEKVFKTDTVPSARGNGVHLYCAKNETEPFLIIAQPTQSKVTRVEVDDFGAGITTEIFQVKYVNIQQPTDYLGRVGQNPDPLLPVDDGDSISLAANTNNAFWFSVHVPESTPAGDYQTNVLIGDVSVPVTLHVFNFTLPAELHVKSQMNFNYRTVLNRYGVPIVGEGYWDYVDKLKQFFMDHRLTPKSVLWPGGVTSASSTNGTAFPFVDYDCSSKTITDNDGIWGFELLAQRYLQGTGLLEGVFDSGFNDDIGFPSFMGATFYNNDPSLDQRKESFCGVTRRSSDWLANPSSNYNRTWFGYITALEQYLQATGTLDRTYYYIANEPQDQPDYDAVAWYSRYLKDAAPNLKLMVSEEPKPEIYEHPDYLESGQIDIWLAHLGSFFNPEISADRLKNHGEESWIYFLKSTYLPRFNPITIDHPGIEGKLLGWFLWKYRLRGVAYYQFNTWSSNPWNSGINPYGQNGERFLMYPPSQSGDGSISYGANNHRFVPSIRLELIRDGLEDYEYFYLLAGSSQPEPGVVNNSDPHVDKIISTAIAYNRDSKLMYNLRKKIGLWLGGEIDTIDNLVPEPAHQRAATGARNYYINFQDPNGEPAASPLTVNGKTYLKVGNDLYDPEKGYGWLKAADVPPSGFYGAWDNWIDPEPKELLGSSVINSWGREDVFEFDLPNSIYRVTVCSGSRSSPRKHRVVIEGEVFIDNEVTNNDWITVTREISVRDHKLTLQMGMFGEVSYVNYLEIEPVDGQTPELQDVVSILQALTGKNIGLSVIALDFTEDGRIGTDDAIYGLNKIAIP